MNHHSIALLVAFLFAAPAHAAAAAAVPNIRLELVTRKLEFPVYLTHDGTPRRFVVEQHGRIRILAPDGAALAEPYLDISDRVFHQGEMGLLGLAFHPDFAKNGLFYVNYTVERPKRKTIVSEFHADPKASTADKSSERIVITIDQPYANHNGGDVVFGPDGMLYIGMGDGGAANDPENRAQNPRELLGKVLRLDVSPRSGYAIPKDNPFASDKRFRPEIWTLGMRNPWRFSFDRLTHTCFAGDVGQNAYEEVDVLTKGGNYGWHIREGLHPFRDETPQTGTPLIDPIAEYGRDKGASVTGGYVYRGKQFPSLAGIYFYADYVSSRFWGLRYDDKTGKVLARDELKITLPDGKPTLNRVQPSSFGEDVDGELYVCDHTKGNIFRIVAAN